MEIKNHFEQALRCKWYTQGFNAVPLFLNPSAWSGCVMDKVLSYRYQHFFHHYRHGYGEMSYDPQDFEKVWQAITFEMEKQPAYLQQIEKQYKNIFAGYEPTFIRMNKQALPAWDETELLELFKHLVRAQIDSVGVAHILEAAGVGLERAFVKALQVHVNDPHTLNELHIFLTTPTQPSFVAQEETALRRIADLAPEERSAALERHLADYFWVRNSYAGADPLTLTALEERLHALAGTALPSFLTPTEKQARMDELHLPEEIHTLVARIDFATIWQDERKANILKTIGYLGRVVDEVHRRYGIAREALLYLGVTESLGLTSFQDLKAHEQKFAARQEGVMFSMEGKDELVTDQTLYQHLFALKNKEMGTAITATRELHGSTANGGTAIGRVVVCKDLASANKVQPGDILVTSMTRPELMPVLKQVAAIITDEGGITCHAAIVARELNIPAIIGTRTATQVLRDGMQVEVKANHGVVRIL